MESRFKIGVISSVVLLFCSIDMQGQGLIRDLGFDGLKYDENIPRFDSTEDPSGSNYFFLDTKRYIDYFLAISGHGAGSVFIDGQLVFQPESRRFNQIWSIDSLAKKYSTDSVLISISGINNTTAQVIQGESSKFKSVIETELLFNKRVENRSDKNLWVILLLLLGLIMGVYRMKYPKSFASLFSASEIFRLRPRENFFYELKIMQAPNLVHYVSFAILLTLFISKNWDSLELRDSLSINYLIVLLFVFLFALIYHLFKFVIVSFFARLFGLSTFTKVHYIESIRLSLVILSLAVLSSFIPGENLIFLEPKTLLMSLFVISIGLIFTKLLNKTLDKKLYLFSYICSTEIIPLLFIIKVFK